jgi:NAD(P)H-nitrite reductase large subunit
VTTASGAVFAYDALILATGSYPFVPPVPGHDAAGAFVYRTVEDVRAIKDFAAGRKAGAVVGGGLLGLEAAGALRAMGLETHVVEFAPRLMSAQVDEGGGQALLSHISALGVTVHAATCTEAVETGEDGTVYALVLAKGDDLSALPVDLVVFAAGVRARDRLGREAGLACGERGGIKVDEFCRTEDPAIYAIGECAQTADGRVYGLVAPGYAMAETVADHVLGGQPAPFRGADLSTRLKLLGVEVASFGDAFGATPGALSALYSDSTAGLYKKLVIAEDGRLLAEHGSGEPDGCEVCKPAVASILASLGGTVGRARHILDGEQAALQDTNDHFLANLQRNGSYSVVPRIPGGEITPQKLLALGEVARDFGLYTKITGGQRIELFGARVEQLPLIWRRLVDAGFESGHAYGKALRTVKSCVGSEWCRYGVQESVKMAIGLELRYRGLRSPHKVKAAVSGCARECAEARGKDFGVVATERGWNLYVGGNGGFRPRHADLLAADLSDAQLIRTIDRFLMFYIRTADRLERTAAWIERMEGGLDHLRAVVLDDSLGLCGELDRLMEQHVANYGDEWRAALEDPDTLRRFVSFVNDPGAPDPSIAFRLERGQIKPLLTIGPMPGGGRPMPDVGTPVSGPGHVSDTQPQDIETNSTPAEVGA